MTRRLGLLALLVVAFGACRDAFDTAPKNLSAALQAGEGALELKFAEPLLIRVNGQGRLESEAGADLTAIQAVLDGLSAEVKPLITVPPDRLQAMYNDAQRVSPGQTSPDLLSWHRVTLPAGANASAAIQTLSARPEIAYVYPAPGIVPPPVTPDFSSNQNNYFGAAPSGTEAVYARSLAGGRGAGVTLVDAEYDWNTSHEDLAVNSTLLTGERYTGFGNDHGTSVLGELAARDNGFGVIGGVPDANVRISGVMFGGVRNVTNSVSNTSSQLTVGDVILIEQQEDGPASGSGDFVPVEWVQSVFYAISAATLAGRIVLEPAGNGNQNLDDPIFQGKFNRNNRNSRAIIVGAGDGNNARLPFSTYGLRVDVQAHGTSVTTTGGGDLYGVSANEFYTFTFNGTSSASPIIASAATMVQGYQKYHGRSVLTATGMAGVLTMGASAQTGDTTQNIGPKPNLRNVVQQLDAATPLVSATITGSDYIYYLQSTTCTYYASASGGLAPIVYQWSFQYPVQGYSPENGKFIGTASGTSGQGSLTVTATDALGQQRSATKIIRIQPYSPPCS